jgi:arabinogalactan oligomer/maltooligosaccharide transport system substrate-binding protein
MEEKLMKKKLFRGFAIAATLALAAGLAVTPAQANTTVVVWADETRGPNLKKALADKADWVSGVTIEVVTFTNFDALNAAVDNMTASTANRPDIVVGPNSWVTKLAKNAKLAPLTLTTSQKAGFNSGQLYDMTYKKKLYGIPVDVNNVAMIYNTKLVKTAPQTFGDMVDYYTANKSSKSLKAGLCIAGGGMSWGAHSVASALGADAFYFNSDGTINKLRAFNPSTFGKNVKKYLLAGNKGNGFFPASDSGCKENFLDGTVPFAVIGNWEWSSYADAGFTMNQMPVPGLTASKPGKAFGSVSGAMLTVYAKASGREAAAKSVLVDFFGSAAGQAAYQKYEKRAPAQAVAATNVNLNAAQRGFGASAAAASIPEIGVILNGPSGGISYWDALPAFWTAVLIDGKDAVAEARKLAAIYKANLTAAKNDI